MPTANQTVRKVPKTSVTILDKARYLIQSTRKHFSQVTSELKELLNPPPTGEGDETQVDWGAVQTAHLDHLVVATEEASAAGRTHRAAKVAVTDAIKLRGQMEEACLRHYRQLRAQFKLVYTVLRWHLLDLDQPLENPLAARRERWSDFHQHLLDPELANKLGEPEDDQEPINLQKAALSFGSRLETFNEAMDRVTEARKQRDEALVAKQEAEDRLSLVYANVARVQEGHLRMAGMKELAERIRLTIPKTSKKEPGDTETTEAAP